MSETIGKWEGAARIAHGAESSTVAIGRMYDATGVAPVYTPGARSQFCRALNRLIEGEQWERERRVREMFGVYVAPTPPATETER